jgi:N-dimethylarginine dimethylaminohydrolase
MCRPTYFDVTYSINPWMKPHQPTSTQASLDQWKRLHDLFVDLGHTVEQVTPIPGLPDMVYSANGAFSSGGRALVARFRHAQRAGESQTYLEWFRARGWDVRQATFTNEGQGDFLLAGELILAGSGFRTDPRAHDEVAEFFGQPVVGLRLVDPSFYHLDTALAVLDDHEIMFYPPAFDPTSRKLLADLFPDAIEASEADALVFGLNAVSDGRNVILARQARRLAGQLRERGFNPIGLDLSELLKGGGGIKCCSLELRGGQR